MKDPSSQKPSEQGENASRDRDNKENAQSKLKLRPLVPTGPEQEDAPNGGSGSSPDKNQARLKLKHLMSPLSPHLQKVRESDSNTSRFKPKLEPPSAVPYEEPGEDTLPPGVKPLEGEIADNPSAGNVEPEVPSPPPAIQLQNTTVEAPPYNKEEAPGTGQTDDPEQAYSGRKKETEALVSAPKRKPRPLKFAILLVNFLIVLTAVQYFFDPLGLSIEPFEHQRPVLPDQLRENPAEDAIANAIAPIKSFDDLESVSLESFVQQLEDARIMASNSPKGIIIDSIFYPVGGTLHPGLGITVQAVETRDRSAVLTIADAEGNIYEYPAN